ncbi:MAG TPA: hypothetical protein P5534_00210 [Candidatus Paceibacterota bacterium]|nr:hypothetical protein [Candidatus Paceibacterota bacterium]
MPSPVFLLQTDPRVAVASTVWFAEFPSPVCQDPARPFVWFV